MTITELRIENFRSWYGKHTITFGPGLTFVTADVDGEYSDSNAGGKTSLLLAIRYALYGDATLYRCRPPALCNEFAKRMSAGVTLSDGTVIDRHWSSKGVKLSATLNGKSYTEDVVYLQQRIDAHLGLNNKIFGAAVYLGSNALSGAFLYTEPAKRAELLSELIDDSVFATGVEIIKETLKDLDLKLEEWERKEALAREQAATYQSQIEGLREASERAGAQEKARRQDLKDRLARMLSEAKRRELILLDKLPTPLSALEDSRQRDQIRLNEVEAEIRAVTVHKLNGLVEGDSCPVCHNLITYVSVKKTRALHEESRKRRETLQKEMSALRASLDLVMRRIQEVREFESRQKEASRELDFYRTEIAYVEEELQRPSPTLTEFTRQIHLLQDQLKGADAAKEEARAKQSRLLVKKVVYKSLYKGFHKDIKNYMFDALRGHLEYYTDFYLSEVYGEGLKVTYPPRTGVQEKFEILVQPPGSAGRDISTFSGGECLRASLACLLAFRAAALVQTKSKLNFVLLDDPLACLDATGIEHQREVLQSLADDQPDMQIIVTVPTRDFIGNAQELRVIKRGGQSCLAK